MPAGYPCWENENDTQYEKEKKLNITDPFHLFWAFYHSLNPL
jgi:hypothetical protein